MFKRILPAFILIVSLAGAGFAADNITAEDRIIGGAFKGLAKAYVATANIDKLKANNVRKIEIMKEERFRKRCAEVYAFAKEVPLKIRLKYGFTAQTTKAEAIRIIEKLDKPKLYEIIDNVPDPVIADKFLEEMKGDAAGAGDNLMDAVRRAWERLVQKLKAPPLQKTHTATRQ